MLVINRILCSVDFSTPSARALEYALALAERLGAQVDVVHAYEPPAYAVADGTVELPPYPQEGLAKRLRERLEQFVKEKAEAPTTTVHLAEGVPYLQIVKVAKQQQADLIVIGSHGRTGLSHMMLGSVAERVVRTSEVPVLTIKYVRPALGIEVDEELNRREMEKLGVQGVLVLRVTPGSAAEAAGMKGARVDEEGITPGDIIVSIGGNPVDSVAKLLGLLDDHRVGEAVRVEVLRESDRTELTVMLQAGS